MKLRRMVNLRNIRLMSYAMFGIWGLSSVGLLVLANQMMGSGPPPLILEAVKRFSGTMESVPVAYAWSLRLSVLLALIWVGSPVLGIALLLLKRKLEKRLLVRNEKASSEVRN